MPRGQRVFVPGPLRGMVKDVFRDGRFKLSQLRETDAARVSQMKGMAYNETGTPGVVIGEADQVASVPPGQLQADFERLRMQEVVTVHKEDIRPLGFLQRPVPGAAHPGVGLVDYIQAPVPGRIGIQDGRRGIRTAVIHADGFPILKRLGQQAVYAARQVFLHIVAGDDDGNDRHRCKDSTSFPKSKGSFHSPLVHAPAFF